MIHPTLIGKRLLFYGLFYLGLALYFSAMMMIFYRTLHDQKPKWILSDSRIGDNPALNIRPMSHYFMNEKPLIQIDPSSESNMQYWRTELDIFLQDYKIQKNNNNVVDCEEVNPEWDQSCLVDFFKNPNPCHQYFDYGPNQTKGICIFLKLNKIYGWTPDLYVMDELMDSKNSIIILRNDTIPISCEGEKMMDKQNVGPIKFYPNQGFNVRYFPYLNTVGYLSPLVAIHFENPKRGVLINIICRAWDKNIRLDYTNRRGFVRFGLIID